jgi:hypothetical protein
VKTVLVATRQASGSAAMRPPVLVLRRSVGSWRWRPRVWAVACPEDVGGGYEVEPQLVGPGSRLGPSVPWRRARRIVGEGDGAAVGEHRPLAREVGVAGRRAAKSTARRGDDGQVGVSGAWCRRARRGGLMARWSRGPALTAAGRRGVARVVVVRSVARRPAAPRQSLAMERIAWPPPGRGGGGVGEPVVLAPLAAPITKSLTGQSSGRSFSPLSQ